MGPAHFQGQRELHSPRDCTDSLVASDRGVSDPARDGAEVPQRGRMEYHSTRVCIVGAKAVQSRGLAEGGVRHAGLPQGRH